MLQCTICKGNIEFCNGCPDARKARHERRLRLRDPALGAILEQVAKLIEKLPSESGDGSRKHPVLHLGHGKEVFDALSSVAGAQVEQINRDFVGVEVAIGRVTITATADV